MGMITLKPWGLLTDKPTPTWSAGRLGPASPPPRLHRARCGTSHTYKGPPRPQSCLQVLPPTISCMAFTPWEAEWRFLSQEKAPGEEAHAGSGSRLRNIRERKSRTPVIQTGGRLGMSRRAQPKDPQSMGRGTPQGEQGVEAPCQVPRADRSRRPNTIIEATYQVPRLACRDSTNEHFHTLVEERTKQKNGYSRHTYWVASVLSNSLQPPGLYSPPSSSVHRILKARTLE